MCSQVWLEDSILLTLHQAFVGTCTSLEVAQEELVLGLAHPPGPIRACSLCSLSHGSKNLYNHSQGGGGTLCDQ